MSVEYNDEIIKKIKIVFPESVIEGKVIQIYEDTDEIQYRGCFEFIIYKDYISIEWLRRCGIITGSQFLDSISRLAIELPQIKYIQLRDESVKKICDKEICLITITILVIGKSWYNKHGYFSDDYQNEISLNNVIISKNFNNFIKEWPELWITKFKEQNLFYLKELKQKLALLELSLGEAKISDNLSDKDKDKQIQLLEAKCQNKKEEIEKITEMLKSDIPKKREISTLIQDCKIGMGNQLFNNLDVNKTVSEYFKNIWQQIIDNIRNKKCDDKKVREQYNWLINFIWTIKKVVVF